MATVTASPMTLTQKIIAIAVTILIITTVAIPVIENIDVSTTRVYNNTDAYYSNLITDSSTHTISFDNGAIFVDSQEVEVKSGLRAPIVVANNVVMSPAGGENKTANIFYISSDAKAKVGSIAKADITIDGSAKTIDFENMVNTSATSLSDISVTYSDFCYMIDVTGDYAAIGDGLGTTVDFYVASSADIFAFSPGGWSSTVFAWIYGEDSYSVDGSTVSLDVTLNDIPEFEDVYKVTLTSSASTSGVKMVINSSNTLPNVIIVPKSTVGVDHNESMNDLIQVIPILLIIVPVMMAVRMIALKRN